MGTDYQEMIAHVRRQHLKREGETMAQCPFCTATTNLVDLFPHIDSMHSGILHRVTINGKCFFCSELGFFSRRSAVELVNHLMDNHKEELAMQMKVWAKEPTYPLGPVVGTFSDLPPAGNLIPAGQGKRDKIRPRYELIPLEFLDELASIFEEGLKPRPGLPEGYGDSWKSGGPDFLRDCLNHAFWHLKKYQDGDRSENHLAKVAWGCLAVKWHETMSEEPKEEPK